MHIYLFSFKIFEYLYSSNVNSIYCITLHFEGLQIILFMDGHLLFVDGHLLFCISKEFKLENKA